MPLASSSAHGFRDSVTNGLEAYSIIERIAASERCVVYRVICKSGRLRNRELALKKISNGTKHSLPLSIHHTLHHPNIVSLFSSFSLSVDQFHVLELCSAGNLQDFLHTREPPTLTEDEVRGVIKSICDALTYLRKELVVHRDVKPSNILLSGDYGVKLSGFDCATRLYSIDPTVPFAQDPFNYTAPEALLNTSHGFAVDVWSMGCVMVTCLSGTPPFQGKTIPDVLEKISLSEYNLPTGLLSDTKALIAGILQIQPENRTPLPHIISHPFLVSPTAVTPLRQTKAQSPSPVKRNLASKERFQGEENHPLTKKTLSYHRPPRHSSVNFTQTPSVSRTRVVLRDIANTELRALLESEITTNITTQKPCLMAPTRRVVSDPAPRSTGLVSSIPIGVHLGNRYIDSSAASPLPVADDNLAADSSPGPSVADSEHRRAPPLTMDTSKVPQALPVGTTRPVQFNTAQLNGQTHKTTYGQVTILPSRSVLVDFRESQRRRGLKGDEVFVVDSSGFEVSVYSAPHLSSPCCLVEPTQQFSLHTLPPAYWKQYNDAGHLIDQIKQRTPKLILYATAAKCTLMANPPQGDIELMFGGSSGPKANKGRGQDKNNQSPSIRIRLSRKCQMIELAQHLSGDQGEEWTKISLSATKKPPYVSAKDWSSLNEAQKEAMNHLACFVRKCEALEILDVGDDTHTSSMDPTSTALVTPVNSQLDPTIGLYSAPKISHSLSSINLAPRPRFSTTAAPRSILDNKDDDTVWQKNQSEPRSDTSLEVNLRTKLGGIDLPTTWFANDSDMTDRARGVETRFIPSVGWCIRYASSVSQGGRYRIMFLDGVALDIDVDEDWVEFRSQSGETTRHTIRDCNSKRKIGERLKVFEEFVSLFDDSQQQSIFAADTVA